MLVFDSLSYLWYACYIKMSVQIGSIKEIK